MIKFKRFKLFWLLIAALLALAAIFKYVFFANNKQNYITAISQRGDIELSVLASGVVKPEKLVAVGAQTTGKIVSLNVNPGDRVRKGDIIAVIDSVNQENNLAKAQQALLGYKAKLQQANIQLSQAKAKLARSRTLLDSKVIMSSSYNDDAARVDIEASEVSNLEAQIKQAELDVASAKLALSYTKIKAPIDGMVLANLVQEGQSINAVQSVPRVAILGDVRRMNIFAQISEADISKVKLGQQVSFSVMGSPSHIYQARLERLEPAPESIRDDINFNSSARTGSSSAIYYNGIFSIDNSDGCLLTYMNCEVHILLAKANDVILIPSSALENISGNDAMILVKQGDNIEQRKIKIGLNNKVMVEVKSGLEVGEEVVISSGAEVVSKKSDVLAPPHRVRMR